ncbi:MAG TPA: S9 family peptidase [Tenuifilaceae bacterium]|jgi:dipeptidyl aminopeptidase/acylaminoacyl peptidase|nr:S9 family peptidase [Tenuifilaceae bacterium]HOC37186.1 S9 family peptidase [Tenuifilaceae bacterium]HPH00514.1 S9 family peptidase [Tenuifilaceae bacterium]HRC94587.1 S9 family peptidase [Tenuifilaceae bacterium]
MKYSKTILYLCSMTLLISNSGCNKANKPAAPEPLSINVSLSDSEKAAGLLTPEILWKFGRVGEYALSPDGTMLVYAVTFYNLQENKGVTNLYVVSATGGEPLKLTDETGSESAPQWSSDGQTILFLSTRGGSNQLWQVRPDGSELKQISGIDGDINGFSFSPDNTKLVFAVDVKLDQQADDIYPDMPKAKVRIIDNLMYRHWNYWEDGRYSHLFVADFADGKISNARDINAGEKWDTPMAVDFDMTEVQWSPDGSKLVYASKKLYGREYAVSTNSDIYLYDMVSGATTNLSADNPGYDRYPSFSPNGAYISWWSMKTPGYEADQKKLVLFDTKSNAKTTLTESFDQNVDSYVWDGDSRNIYFASEVKGTAQLYKLNISTDSIYQLTRGAHNYTSCQKGNGVLVAERMSMSMAPELYRIDEQNGSAQQLTFTNKQIYESIKMGEVRERWVKTTDGKEMLVWVILPPNFDETKKYPALLFCQGGPQSTVGQFWSYRWNFQIMAANGYVVVAPNRRGVPSFGQEWTRQISGDYSGQNIDDYLSAIDDVKKEPWVDANRLGCVGASYGGYSVFYLASHHQKRFKAFIAHCGMYNLESFYAQTEETFFAHFDLGGAPWEGNNPVARRSYANSPHKFVQNWDTPIMIITGEHDYRIPYTQSIEAFNAAQLRGIPSKLLFFPEETHFVTKPQNSVIWQREFFAWLDRWLK